MRLRRARPRPTSLGRRLAARLPGPPELWRLAGHAGFLVGLGFGASSVWHRAMQRIEAGTSADVPVLEPGEADRWVPPTASGGPGSLVPWAGMGREGRRHALASVRPQPVPTARRRARPVDRDRHGHAGPRAPPCRCTSGWTTRRPPRERVDLAMAELERTGAFDRSLLVLVSPTGTGYVNYVAMAAAAVPDARRRRHGHAAVLPPAVAAVPRHGPRPPASRTGCCGCGSSSASASAPARGPRVVLFGESLGAHTSQDVFLHWGTLGLDAMGIDRALWIGTPYGSKWMHQVTRGDRLDVDRDSVAVVNDYAQLAGPGREAGHRPRFVLLSHDNDGVTKFGHGPAAGPRRTGWAPTGRCRSRSRRAARAASRRRMRWRPITTFFQSLIDMKNAQVPGPFRAWAHDYRADLPRVLSDVYDLPATPEQLARIEEALQVRETRARAGLRRGAG